MSRTLSEITMDNIMTVRETAHAVAVLSVIADECGEDTQVGCRHFIMYIEFERL